MYEGTCMLKYRFALTYTIIIYLAKAKPPKKIINLKMTSTIIMNMYILILYPTLLKKVIHL